MGPTDVFYLGGTPFFMLNLNNFIQTLLSLV